MQFIIKTHGSEGHPELNLVKIDPFYIKNISNVDIGTPDRSSYANKIEITETYLRGLKTIKVKSAEYEKAKTSLLNTLNNNLFGFCRFARKKNQVKGSAEMETPKLTINGMYDIDGQLYLLPFKGKGPYDVTLLRPVIGLKYLGKLEKSGDSEFIKIDKIRVTFNAARGSFNFANLFNNDPTLQRTIHEFINNNFVSIFERFNEPLFGLISNFSKEIVQNVFDKIPYDELFLKD